MDIKIELSGLRDDIRLLDERVSATRSYDFFTPGKAPDQTYTTANPGEMQANLTLAHRHLEDARMRLGKAIQALEGGVSIYDK